MIDREEGVRRGRRKGKNDAKKERQASQEEVRNQQTNIPPLRSAAAQYTKGVIKHEQKKKRQTGLVDE